MEHCQICGEDYETVYELPDWIWDRISPKEPPAGLLCPKCADAKARDVGIELYWSAKEDDFPWK